MNYDEACEATFSRAEALHEIDKHDVSLAEFFADVGDRAKYTGQEVLDWLGY